MSDFKAKNASKSISVGALPQTPLGELTVLPDPVAGIKGKGRSTEKGRREEGDGGRGEKGERRGKRWERKGGREKRGRERRKGRGDSPYQSYFASGAAVAKGYRNGHQCHSVANVAHAKTIISFAMVSRPKWSNSDLTRQW